jgi:hypothetical protein
MVLQDSEQKAPVFQAGDECESLKAAWDEG